MSAEYTHFFANFRNSYSRTAGRHKEGIGLSKRTLQRYLNGRETTYSSLVDQVRYDLAIPLLNDKSISITEIAHELAYANVAHFSRAFRRFGGMLPSFYRRMQGK